MAVKTKYQIFISSTYEDLKKERDVVLRCVLEMGHIPVGMELFSAADEAQWDVIKRQIDECDYYLVIVAHKYGSMDGTVSFTEKEYDYALSKGVPALAFIIQDSARWPAKNIEGDGAKKLLLSQFKAKVKTKLVSYWESADDLYGKAAVAISRSISTYPRPGYVRTTDVPSSESLVQVSSLATENRALREELQTMKKLTNMETLREKTKLIEVLDANKREVRVMLRGATDWTEPYPMSLLEIFEAVGAYCIDEADFDGIGRAIALYASGETKFREPNPVPRNKMREYLKDLYSLELLEPSQKTHSSAEGKEFWTLTTKGRATLKDLRRAKLYAGLLIQEEAKDAEELIVQQNESEQSGEETDSDSEGT